MEKNVLLSKLKEEKVMLDGKTHRLSMKIDLPVEQRKEEGITPSHYDLLLEQFRAMLAYQTALAKRISLLNSQKEEAKRYGK